MFMVTTSGALAQSVGRELGEVLNEDWHKKENGFRKHRDDHIHTELVRYEGFDLVIDWERKGPKIEYRLDVLSYRASFTGRSREEVMTQFESWLDTKPNRG